MQQDPEMDFLNTMFRSELEKFKGAEEPTRLEVVRVIAEANALDWLIEVAEADDDPQIQSYAVLARRYRNNEA